MNEESQRPPGPHGVAQCCSPERAGLSRNGARSDKELPDLKEAAMTARPTTLNILSGATDETFGVAAKELYQFLQQRTQTDGKLIR